MQFRNRTHGGRLLAERLKTFGVTGGIVLGLPRGGVVTAAEVARILSFPLDVVVVKKIGAPMNEELAIGAVAPGGIVYRNPDMTLLSLADTAYVDTQAQELLQVIAEKTARLRERVPAIDVGGKTVILVDDGIATGATMIAAVRWAKAEHATRVVVAVPVASADAIEKLGDEGVETVVLDTPEPFVAVGQFYDDFRQTEDAEVVQLLKEARNDTV